MTSVKFDLVKYISKPIVGFGLIAVYDKVIGGSDWNDAMFDGIYFGGSVLTS
jgi:hypothetical protein